MTQVGVIGAGMIVHDQILPSLYQLQRQGKIGEILICARNQSTLDALRENERIKAAFPGQTFQARPGDYKEFLAELWSRSIIIIALPDQLHNQVIMDAIAEDQHIICVKPLVLSAAQSVVIEKESRERELLVAVEYHKRFDDRSLMARKRYREGQFGEFKLGNAWLHEKWYYRDSNFQNWFTCENSDAFTYIGCHYVDLVHFITGLKPVSVSVYGMKEAFPNGNVGYLWADTRVIWENGACLNLQNSLGYPQNGPGSNAQGIVMYCSGNGQGAMIRHSDQYRGLEYSTTDHYEEPSPDYFQYVSLGSGPGLTPVGYGYRSIDQLVSACLYIDEGNNQHERIDQINDAGVIATPKNSRYNELVVEAGRLSLANNGREATIDYASNTVHLR
jgi:D-galacturonate reductase